MRNKLLNYLKGQTFFIEAEAKRSRMKNYIDEYNRIYGQSLSIDDDGIIALDETADKWGLELRLYVKSCPPDDIRKRFTHNEAYRSDFSYRLNDNETIKWLFEKGYRIGPN